MKKYIETMDGKIDYIKTTIEHLKFMVTISSAFIVAVMTLLEKVFNASTCKELAYISILSFVTSIFLSVFAHIMCVDSFQYQNDSDEYIWKESGPGKSILFAWLLFLSGIVFICTFVAAS